MSKLLHLCSIVLCLTLGAVLPILVTATELPLRGNSSALAKPGFEPNEVDDIQLLARIIGGRDAQPDSFPSTVALARSGTFPLMERFFCGATVVAPRWVMTAAHCLYDAFGNVVRPSTIRVVPGVRNLQTDTPSEEIIVSSIYIHPEYNTRLQLPPNDIALLELGTEVDAPSVRLFAGETPDFTGETASIAGWGATRFVDENDATFPSQLQEAEVPLVSLGTCNSIVSYQGLVTERQVCAGLVDGGVDACTGDSGGPLFVSENGENVQLGITSFGNSCALPNFYGIYTSVSHFLPWLSNYIDVPFQSPELISSRQEGGSGSSENGSDDLDSENGDTGGGEDTAADEGAVETRRGALLGATTAWFLFLLSLLLLYRVRKRLLNHE